MNEFEKTNGDIEAEKIRTQLKKEQFIKQKEHTTKQE
jgi:hypothetical protein